MRTSKSLNLYSVGSVSSCTIPEFTDGSRNFTVVHTPVFCSPAECEAAPWEVISIPPVPGRRPAKKPKPAAAREMPTIPAIRGALLLRGSTRGTVISTSFRVLVLFSLLSIFFALSFTISMILSLSGERYFS